MHGLPAAPSRTPRPATLSHVLRWVLAAVPFLSLGLLAWVPFIRIARIRRSPLYWFVLVLYCALTVGEIVFFAVVPENSEGDLSVVAGFYVVVLMTGGTCHAAVAGSPAPEPPHAAVADAETLAVGPAHAAPPRRTPTVIAPAPPPAVPPSPRMCQVASELDELDAYLKGQENGT
ncbi:hypothetical protein [Streptomyces sp. RFCAC02]|uniref:hypothetical protein n=1 Tax=Streptomyces sp. RFCAC02 TaxID=2499143 RepID=UPI001020FE73|nr:hypothetical protein [Streptomyces sp. RFCAC02]